jgi:hypothetical protein
MEVKVDTSQIKVLQDFFLSLSAIDQAKVFMGSYRKASRPLVEAIKARVPRLTGNLYRSIGTVENNRMYLF